MDARIAESRRGILDPRRGDTRFTLTRLVIGTHRPGVFGAGTKRFVAMLQGEGWVMRCRCEMLQGLIDASGGRPLRQSIEVQ